MSKEKPDQVLTWVSVEKRDQLKQLSLATGIKMPVLMGMAIDVLVSKSSKIVDATQSIQEKIVNEMMK